MTKAVTGRPAESLSGPGRICCVLIWRVVYYAQSEVGGTVIVDLLAQVSFHVTILSAYDEFETASYTALSASVRIVLL